jgi:hypothetical protein
MTMLPKTHVLMALTVLLAGCSTIQITEPVPSLDQPGPPTVSIQTAFLTLYKGKMYLPLDQSNNLKFTLFFSEEMDVTTLASNITLTDQDGKPVPYTHKIDPSKVWKDEYGQYRVEFMTFSGVSENLKPSTAYTLKVAANIKDRSGETLGFPQSLGFTTSDAPYTLTVQKPVLSVGSLPSLQVELVNQGATIKSFMLTAICGKNLLKTHFYRYVAELAAHETRTLMLSYASGNTGLSADTPCAFQGELQDSYGTLLIE